MRARIPSVRGEFAESLADRRLNRRLGLLVDALRREPARSLPRALGTVAAAEAGYRFLRNRRVTPDALSAGHREQTWRRAADAELVLSVEDTTEVRFNGVATREGLGSLINDGQGFFLHAALLVGMGAHPVPLGVGAYETLVREHGRPSRKKGTHWKQRYRAPDNERLRWHRVSATVGEQARSHGLSVIHVADREADEYSLLSRWVTSSERFVARLRFDRKVLGTGEWATDVVERAEAVAQREVPISARTKSGKGRRKSQQPRRARQATLALRVAQVTFPRPSHAVGEPALCLNLVDVVELAPPDGEEPIRWLLLTTEPVTTVAEIERVVDIYRARWLIEEFWKALKTGCAYEDRQLESRTTLENALAIFLPMAWHMLLVRTTGRCNPEAPPTAVVTAAQLALLRRIARVPTNRWGLRLPTHPNARDIMLAIARMGGHLPQNGDPGWLILRRGLDDLYALEAAAELLGM